MKKRIIGFALLFLWILQSTCALIVYKIERHQCYQQIIAQFKNKIPSDQIQTFVFENVDAIHWERKFAEFEISNEIFDVVSLQTTNGKIVVQCVADKNEEAIVAYYKALNSEKNKKSDSSVFKKLLDIKCLSLTAYLFPLPSYFEKLDFAPPTIREIKQNIEIQLPPPKC